MGNNYKLVNDPMRIQFMKSLNYKLYEGKRDELDKLIDKAYYHLEYMSRPSMVSSIGGQLHLILTCLARVEYIFLDTRDIIIHGNHITILL